MIFLFMDEKNSERALLFYPPAIVHQLFVPLFLGRKILHRSCPKELKKKKTNIILIVLFEITKCRLKMHSCLEPFLIGPMAPLLR
jgi:hypothetical protein